MSLRSMQLDYLNLIIIIITEAVVVSHVSLYHLPNRFHVAVPLFSNRSQMTSKCGKNKTWAQKPVGVCVTHVVLATS